MQAHQTTSSRTWSNLDNPPDFSLVLGGPLFQLLRRAHLANDALQMVRQRVIVISLFTWLPLLLLSALEGQLFGGSTTVPFLKDIEVHIRFLVALPLLIVAELVVHQRMRPLLKQFLERKLIPEADLPRFEAAVDAAFRLRNSVVAEILLIVLVYGFGVLVIWRQYIALDTATWYAVPGAGGKELSLAGIWFGYVSLPVFQFLLCRWYFRLFIWTRFLWQVSRIQLQLIPAHPDQLGGLSFLSGQIHAFAALAVAHGALLAGTLASRIFFLGAQLPQFKFEIGSVVLFMLCLVFLPLLVFGPQLAQAKRKGSREYGVLAQDYVRRFDEKWLRGGAKADDELLGSGDIQSLADLGNSFSVVRSMRIVPVKRDDIIRLTAATLAPIVPLALTMMSLEDLLKTLFGVLF